MNQLGISVVTISYNQAPYLRRALESVLSNSDVEIEYIVIDPGSTDGSRDIIDEFRPRLQKVVFEPDAGPADALNKGLRLATHPLFYYLNSDDEVCTGAFAKAAKIFQDHPHLDVVYGNGEEIDAGSNVKRRIVSSAFVHPRLYTLGATTIVQQASFMRTDKLRAAGGFNPANRTCWDGEAFLRLAAQGARFQRVWDTWGRFRTYEDTITSQINSGGTFSKAYYAEWDRLFEEVWGRRRTALDRASSLVARAGVHALDPLGTAAKVRARLGHD